jgi:hypothetical protein
MVERALKIRLETEVDDALGSSMLGTPIGGGPQRPD